MARFLLATLPLAGHGNPGLPNARALIQRGHEVWWYTVRRFRSAVEATGAKHVPMQAAFDPGDSNFATMTNDLDALLFEPHAFIAQGDSVVALGHYAWRVKATGKEFSSDWAHVDTLRDGKIVRFKEYMDTAAEVKAHKKRRASKAQ